MDIDWGRVAQLATDRERRRLDAEMQKVRDMEKATLAAQIKSLEEAQRFRQAPQERVKSIVELMNDMNRKAGK